MTFLVEDGTGLDGANSYAAVADADAYFALRGVTSWAGTNSQKQAWLVQATDFIDYRYALRFLGTPVSATQGLAFPRTGIDGVEGIPEALKRAAYEYANRARVAPLIPDPTRDASGKTVSAKTVKVGPIETTTSYEPGASTTVPSYPAVDGLLTAAGLLSTASRVYR